MVREEDGMAAPTTSDTSDLEKQTTQTLQDNQDDQGQGQDQLFEAIRSRSNATRVVQATRTRSHWSTNGYGVDESDQHESSPSDGSDDDKFLVAFEGGDADPWCPRSMPKWRKWMIVLITSCGSFCVTCASSMYTSTYSQMRVEFHTTNLVCTLGLSTFVLGIALGPIWSPLSEFYGRKPIYIASFLMFAIWLIPCAVAKNIETVIVSRFFQGLAGSAFLSVAGGTVGDLFTPDTMLNPMTVFTLAPFIGPSVGPLIGGFINDFAYWRWTHYVLIIWAVCLLLALTMLVPETLHTVVLRHKAMAKRKETEDDRWKAPIDTMQKSFVKTVGNSLLRPFEILLFEPMALLLNLYSAILLGVLYLFFGAFPLVFENNHGFTLWQVGLSFLGIFAGNLLSVLFNPIWVKLRSRAICENGGKAEPEYRLYQLMAGCVLVPTGMFWFAWSTFPWVHWIVPILGSAVFGAGVFLAFASIFTFLVESYAQYAASALASNALLRCSFAAAFPLFGIQMYERLGYQWATSLLAFLTLAMLPFPFLFFKYGKTIRKKSRLAVHD